MTVMANGKKDVDPAYTAHCKMPKVERYGWHLLDTQGQFEWVNKKDLCFDPTYQRDPTTSKVRAIASKWSWIACGILILSRRKGKLYVVDGNHRLEAALMRADIDQMPCMIHEIADVADEARAFLLANKNRKPMTTSESFKAMCVAGDPDALKLKSMIEGSGYKTSKTAGAYSVKCVGSLMTCMKVSPEVFPAVWPLIVEASRPNAINERVALGLVYIESRLKAIDGGSILRQPWRDRVVKLGKSGMQEAAAKAAAFYSKGGAKVWALGIVEALNRGVRNRLSLDAANPDGE